MCDLPCQPYYRWWLESITLIFVGIYIYTHMYIYIYVCTYIYIYSCLFPYHLRLLDIYCCFFGAKCEPRRTMKTHLSSKNDPPENQEGTYWGHVPPTTSTTLDSVPDTRRRAICCDVHTDRHQWSHDCKPWQFWGARTWGRQKRSPLSSLVSSWHRGGNLHGGVELGKIMGHGKSFCINGGI